VSVNEGSRVLNVGARALLTRLELAGSAHALEVRAAKASDPPPRYPRQQAPQGPALSGLQLRFALMRAANVSGYHSLPAIWQVRIAPPGGGPSIPPGRGCVDAHGAVGT
jgi:hypothetical protein